MATVLINNAAETVTLANTFTVDGVATDPTTITLTVTDPTGTATSYTYAAAQITRTSTGVYSKDITVPTAGAWTYLWVGTGTASDAAAGTFHVETAVLPPLIDLAEAKTWLRVSQTGDDGELLDILLAATEICEERTRQTWRRRTITAETHDWDGRDGPLELRHRPVESITTVTVSGSAVTDYVLDGRRGLLWRGTSTAAACWPYGIQDISVTYVAVPTDGIVPAYIRRGFRVLVQHLWQTQRGGTQLPRQAGAGSADAIDPRTGFSFPRRVLEMWGVSDFAGPMAG